MPERGDDRVEKVAEWLWKRDYSGEWSPSERPIQAEVAREAARELLALLDPAPTDEDRRCLNPDCDGDHEIRRGKLYGLPMQTCPNLKQPMLVSPVLAPTDQGAEGSGGRDGVEFKSPPYITREHAIAAVTNALSRQGYAVAVHGSRIRDLDLVAIPWQDTALDAQDVVEIAAEAVGGMFGPPEQKPHGRVGYTIRFIAEQQFGFDRWYIDFSVMPRLPDTETPEGGLVRVKVSDEEREDFLHIFPATVIADDDDWPPSLRLMTRFRAALVDEGETE